jgi:hypothetical protein
MKAAQKAKIMMMTLSHPVLALDGILWWSKEWSKRIQSNFNV